ncbi:MAG: hypothetical protein AAFX06_25615, partial [Planctomycetota bacterium]
FADDAPAANFAISAINDSDVDGTQSVTIAVAAAGHTGDSRGLSVNDDDVPADEPADEPVSHQFDFGTVSSPLQPEFTRVTGSTTYNASRGFGWTSAVNDLDRRSGTSLTRDLHYTGVATFLVDVPNGTYEVTLTVGDSGPSAHDQTISIENVTVDSVTTRARQFSTRTYTTVVNDGQLTITLDGRGGVDQNMVISGLALTSVGATSDPDPEPEPTPELSLAFAGSSISENGGSTIATVSRSGSTSESVVVTLASSDTSEAIVPATVTIAAGQTSATFNVTGVDDSVVDGTQSVTVSVSAGDHDGDSRSLSVADDDTPPPPPPPPPPSNDPVSHQFDFGTSTSPLQSDHTRITGATTYNATRGFGWTSAVNDLDRRSGNSLTRDLHYAALATFLVDVPNGTYEVTLTVGDSGPSAHDQTITLEGVTVDSVTTRARQHLVRTYETVVNDGQLTVTLDGRGGVDRNMVISGLELTSVGATTEPEPTPELTLSVAGSSISENGGATSATVSRSGDTSQSVVVTLSSSDTGEAVVPTTVTIAAGQSSANFSVTSVDDNVVDGTQSVTLTASADGHDGDSDSLNVTDDDVPPPPSDDPVSHQFDFGTSVSPLQPDHTRVIGSTTYNAGQGYGWTSAVNDLDRRSGTNLTRDLHYAAVGTFLVDVPNGTYEVTLTIGDSGPSAHDQTISIEGVTVDSVTTRARQFLTRTYTAVVNDGQLTITLDGRGGVDRNMVISGLQVTEVSNQQAATSSFRPEEVDRVFESMEREMN